MTTQNEAFDTWYKNSTQIVEHSARIYYTSKEAWQAATTEANKRIADLEVLRKAAADAGAVVTGLRLKLDAAETQKRHLVAGYENAEEEMKKPCSACGKPHTADEIDEWKAHRLTLIEEKSSEIYKLATERSEKQVLVVEAQKAFDDYKATIPAESLQALFEVIE